MRSQGELRYRPRRHAIFNLTIEKSFMLIFNLGHKIKKTIKKAFVEFEIQRFRVFAGREPELRRTGGPLDLMSWRNVRAQLRAAAN